MAEARKLLENLKIDTQYFDKRRLAILLNVVTTIENGRTSSIAMATRNLLAGMARFAGKYLVLEPNFMGLGVNLNAIIAEHVKEEEIITKSRSNS